jgi:catechol 2,3-dioxygenase-like lactoylglutathione lyase family enzyme
MGLSMLLDCRDVEAMARFWSAALGYRKVDDPRSFHLEPPEGLDGPALYLQAVPEPKTAKNRLHLDWDVADMEAEADRLVALSATRGERRETPWGDGTVGWITMQDPEGNEFCLEQVFPDAG